MVKCFQRILYIVIFLFIIFIALNNAKAGNEDMARMYIDNPEYNKTVGTTINVRRLGNVNNK